MRRLLAATAAVAMVAVALVVRDRLDTGDAGVVEEHARLVCATELRPVCEALDDDHIDVLVEPAGATAERLVADAPGQVLDGWLTLGPWPAFVRAARERAGRSAGLTGAGLTNVERALARTPVVMVVWEDRRPVLERACGGPVGWRCVGDLAGRRWDALGGSPAWGELLPGHADPTTSATGLAVVGHAAASFFGTTELSAADLRTDGFLGWFTTFERAVPGFSPTAGSPLEEMLLTGPAAYDLVGDLHASAAALLARSVRREEVALVAPTPGAEVAVVYAAAGDGTGTPDDRLGAHVAAQAPEALAEHGWTVLDGEDDGAAEGLPAAGPLEALQVTWQEVTR